MIIERMIQEIIPGKWAELEAIDQKFNAAEARLGYPPKRRYRCFVGGHNTNTLIIEREWESLAVMEAIYIEAFEDPQLQNLNAQVESIVKSNQIELYMPL